MIPTIINTIMSRGMRPNRSRVLKSARIESRLLVFRKDRSLLLSWLLHPLQPEFCQPGVPDIYLVRVNKERP